MSNQECIYIHSSNGMYIRPFIDDLSCNNITIQQPDEVGSVNIESVPPGAKIYIDEILQLDSTPIIIDNIPSSPTGVAHRYKLTYPGYIDTEGYIFIRTGDTDRLSVIMERIAGAPSDMGKILMLMLGIGTFLFFLSERDKGKWKQYKGQQYQI